MSIPFGASSGVDYGSVCRSEVKELCAVYSSGGIPTLACNAIVEEILRGRPRWYFSDGRACNDDDVPFCIPDLIRRAVASVLQVGYFAYRLDEATFCGDVGLHIGDPLETYPGPSSDGGVKVYGNGAHLRFGEAASDVVWDGVFFTKPLFFSGGAPFIRSRVRVASVALSRFESFCANFVRRDTFNSVPSGFATVSSQLGSVGNETWFRGRDREADASLAPYLGRSVDFGKIVANRAKTIRTLGAETMKRRVGGGNAASATSVSDGGSHTEHLVTDGYGFSEASALQSLGNAPHQYDRLETSCFFSLGVPPQALGKNINSERLASANSLTQAALRMFGGFCSRFRHVLGPLFKESSTFEGRHVAFSKTVKDSDVDDVFGLLRTDRMIDVLSCVHDLPSDWFDANRVSDAQSGVFTKGAVGGGGGPSGDVSSLKRKRDGGGGAGPSGDVSSLKRNRDGGGRAAETQALRREAPPSKPR